MPRLQALRLVGAPGDASPLEREYAALFEPLRQARSVVLAFCAVPGETPSLHDVDVGKARRIAAAAVADALRVDAAAMAAGLASCESALSSASATSVQLVSAYDDLDWTPARVARRLRTLQMAGVVPIAAPLEGEAAYAALFQAVREFRQVMCDALSPVAAAGGAGAASASNGIIAAAIKRLRLTLSIDDAAALERLIAEDHVAVVARVVFAALDAHAGVDM